MLRIDLNDAKFVYKIVMMADIELLRGPLNNIGKGVIGYPKHSGIKLFDIEDQFERVSCQS